MIAHSWPQNLLTLRAYYHMGPSCHTCSSFRMPRTGGPGWWVGLDEEQSVSAASPPPQRQEPCGRAQAGCSREYRPCPPAALPRVSTPTRPRLCPRGRERGRAIRGALEGPHTAPGASRRRGPPVPRPSARSATEAVARRLLTAATTARLSLLRTRDTRKNARFSCRTLYDHVHREVPLRASIRGSAT